MQLMLEFAPRVLSTWSVAKPQLSWRRSGPIAAKSYDVLAELEDRQLSDAGIDLMSVTGPPLNQDRGRPDEHIDVDDCQSWRRGSPPQVQPPLFAVDRFYLIN